MDESEERLFGELEREFSHTDKTCDYYTESVNSECDALVTMFEDHLQALRLLYEQDDEIDHVLDIARKLVGYDLVALSRLQQGDMLETRGGGMYIRYDEGRMCGVDVFTRATSLQGRFVGIACDIVPSDFAIALGDEEFQPDCLEPTLCFMFETVVLVDDDGKTETLTETIGVPVRHDGVQFDKRVYGDQV